MDQHRRRKEGSLTPLPPGTLAVVRPRPDGSSAFLVWTEGTHVVAILRPGTLVAVVCCGQDRFGCRMVTALTVQGLLVRVYNDDIEEVS